MLTEITPRSWVFTDPGLRGFSVRLSKFSGKYEVCFRRQMGPNCFEVQTLSTHNNRTRAVKAVELLRERRQWDEA